jgi:nucleotide-binding universal stress UspA family protein
MFKNILVPLDLTDKHEAALARAAELAKLSSGQVVLLHVVETIAGLNQEEDKAFYARLERAAQSHLQKYAAPLVAQRIRCDLKVVLGHRAHETTAQARTMGADLIILTAPPFKPERPIDGLGSMSWKIGLAAPCPVLLVK